MSRLDPLKIGDRITWATGKTTEVLTVKETATGWLYNQNTETPFAHEAIEIAVEKGARVYLMGSCGCAEEVHEDQGHCDTCKEPIVPVTEIEEMAMSQSKREWIDGLRAMCDFFETVDLEAWSGFVANVSVDDKADMAIKAKLLGSCEKSVGETFFSLIRHFGPHRIDVYAIRDQICEKVKTGTKTETKKVFPEGVELVEVSEEVDVYEWVCPKSILAGVTA